LPMKHQGQTTSEMMSISGVSREQSRRAEITALAQAQRATA
jgi:hypothetical protein